jgi:hypothetical protein
LLDVVNVFLPHDVKYLALELVHGFFLGPSFFVFLRDLSFKEGNKSLDKPMAFNKLSMLRFIPEEILFQCKASL